MQEELFVAALPDGKLLGRHSLPGNIEDVIWCDGLERFFVVSSTTRYGKGPMERLSAFAGHPVSHHRMVLDTFLVDDMVALADGRVVCGTR